MMTKKEILDELEGIIRQATIEEIETEDERVHLGNWKLIDQNKQIHEDDYIYSIIIGGDFHCISCIPFDEFVIEDSSAGASTKAGMDGLYDCAFCGKLINTGFDKSNIEDLLEHHNLEDGDDDTISDYYSLKLLLEANGQLINFDIECDIEETITDIEDAVFNYLIEYEN